MWQEAWLKKLSYSRCVRGKKKSFISKEEAWTDVKPAGGDLMCTDSTEGKKKKKREKKKIEIKAAKNFPQCTVSQISSRLTTVTQHLSDSVK